VSHFTELKTRLTNLDRVLESARKLGFEVEESQGQPVQARGFMGETFEALAVIRTGTRYDIGVLAGEDGNLQFSADWDLLEKVGSLRQEDFQNKIQQQYALCTIQEVAREQGLSVDEPHVAEDGSLEVTVTQW
jgi:hypothetical protein